MAMGWTKETDGKCKKREGDESTIGVVEGKKGVIFCIIFDGQCAVFNNVRGKFREGTWGE
jgi:hypothetical protein